MIKFQSNFGKNLLVCFWLVVVRLAWSEELVVDDELFLGPSSLLACLPNLVVTASMTRLDLFTWPLRRCESETFDLESPPPIATGRLFDDDSCSDLGAWPLRCVCDPWREEAWPWPALGETGSREMALVRPW